MGKNRNWLFDDRGSTPVNLIASICYLLRSESAWLIWGVHVYFELEYEHSNLFLGVRDWSLNISIDILFQIMECMSFRRGLVHLRQVSSPFSAWILHSCIRILYFLQLNVCFSICTRWYPPMGVSPSAEPIIRPRVITGKWRPGVSKPLRQVTQTFLIIHFSTRNIWWITFLKTETPLLTQKEVHRFLVLKR